MVGRIEALETQIAVLRARGLLNSDVEVANVCRALLAARAERATAPRATLFPVTTELQARLASLSHSSRAAARRLGLTRDQLSALRQGRGREPAPAERSRPLSLVEALTGGPQPASRR